MLIEGIYAVLSTNAALQALLGTAASRSDSTTGIFPALAPSEVPMPYIVYQQVAGQPLQESMAGTGALTTSRFRFTCYGTTYSGAKELARVLNQVMISIDGPLPAGEAEVHGVWLKLNADDSEPIPHGTIYANHLDYEINYIDGDVD
jgi:hypothetical protein